MGAMKNLAIDEAERHSIENAEIVAAFRGVSPYDVDRLIQTARAAADWFSSPHAPTADRMRQWLESALAAFPEESPPERPCLPIRCTCNATVAYRASDCPIHTAVLAEAEAFGAFVEPVPPGGGRWATDAEYAAHVEATTYSVEQHRRYTAPIRKERLH